MLVIFVKKPRKTIRFCINYKKLNAITKKDHYLISLIKKTLAQLENEKYFTKIDICQVFYEIKIFKDLKKLTFFPTKFLHLNTEECHLISITVQFLDNTLLIIYYSTFCIILYKRILTIFICIVRY